MADDITAAARRAPLVMRCGAFGDMVLLTVLLTQLRERFGQAVDVIASGPWCEPLLGAHPAVVAGVARAAARGARQAGAPARRLL